MPPRLLSRVIGLGLIVASLVAAPAAAAPFVDGEFAVSSLDSNNHITQGPDGNVWLTLNDATNDVAKITPGGDVEEFNLGAETPKGITTGPDGNLWITQDGGVIKFSPTNPVSSKEATLTATISGFHSIVTGPDGNLWVAASDHLVKIPPGNPSNFDADLVGLKPRDIDTAGSLLAIADFGGKVVTATTDDPPVTTDYPLNGGSMGVAGGPGGQIAFTQQAEEPTEFGLLTPPGPPVLTLAPETDPFGVTFGPDGAYWIAQFASDSVTRLTTDNQASTLGGFNPKFGPRQITGGPGNTVWVTLEDPGVAAKVARISGVEPPVVPTGDGATVQPETRIAKGPKGRVRTKRKRTRVRFVFRSPNAGATFECALQRLKKRKKGKAAPKPRFKPCKSPKRYRLKPGKYRFWVRAVLNGVADPTPAKRTFRIVRVKKR